MAAMTQALDYPADEDGVTTYRAKAKAERKRSADPTPLVMATRS
jgi:hypothetical protein